MNENAQKWIAALRSGEFEQTTTYLTKDDRDCCLGVACKLFVAENPDGIAVVPVNNHVTYGGNDATLPDPVREWLGLADEEGMFIGEDGRKQWLTVLNDRGRTFEEIADIVESNPEGMFT